MKEIYEYTPNGLRLIKYEPKRFFHFHLFEVLIIFGLGVLIGIIGSEYVITNWLPKPDLSACVVEKIHKH